MLRYLRQLASESLVYGLSGVLSKMMYVILVPIYTRAFTPEQYGAMSVVMTAMAAVGIFVVLALDNSAHRWFWDSEDDDHRRRTITSWAWCQLGLSLAVALLLSAAARPIALWLVQDAGATLYVRLLAWSLPLSTLGMVTTNWLRMQRRPWATLLFNLAVVASTGLLTVAFVLWLRLGVAGVFWAQLVTAAWTSLVAALMLGTWIHPRYFDWGRLRAMLRFALPLIPAAISFWVVNAVDRLFVQRYASTADVGIYQVGFVLASVVALATQAFQQAWGPFSLSIHRDEGARPFYAHALLVYLWIGCLLSAAVGMFAPELVLIFATEAYQGATWVTALLSFGYVMVGLGYIAGLGPSLARRTSPIGVAITIAAALNLGLNFLLTPRLGKEGAALATLISQTFVPLYLFWRSQQLYPIPYRFGAAISIPLIAGGITCLGLAVEFSEVWLGVGFKLLLLTLFVPSLLVLRIISAGSMIRVLRRRVGQQAAV